MNPADIRFCPRCGTALVAEIRLGRQRPVCPACEWIYFPDPKVAAAMLIEQDDQVLLVRRVNEPERGRWSLPAGFVDAGEDPARAAERECLEETGYTVVSQGLADVIFGLEHPRGAHILIVYKGKILNGQSQPGDDVDAVAFFSRSALPPLAFQTTRRVLGLSKPTPNKI